MLDGVCIYCKHTRTMPLLDARRRIGRWDAREIDGGMREVKGKECEEWDV